MGPDNEGVSPWAAEQQANLLGMIRWAWGEAYEITVSDAGLWTAKRRDTGDVLEGRSAEDLRKAIFTDYTARPVPRDLDIEMP